jgi:zinc transport system substrate-binding protein
MRYIISFILTSLALSSPLRAGVLTVVTDIPPVQSLVAQVMGDLGTPGVILGRGASVHDFQLRPSQSAALADAGLVVWIGPELTPWLDRALKGLSKDGAQLALLDAEGTHRRGYDEAAAEADHDHAAHGDTDPHAWLDPDNAALWLDLIATALAVQDPDNAATYAANAQTAKQGIATLDARVRATLAGVQDKPFMVFHDGYGYFADHYGLQIAGSLATGDAVQPGAAHLVELRDSLRAGRAVCLFPEAQHDPALAEQIAEGTNVRIGGALDPVGSMLDPGPDTYGVLLEGLAKTVSDCLLP